MDLTGKSKTSPTASAIETTEDYSITNLRRAVACYSGTDGVYDPKRAQKLFRMAAEADNPVAQMWVAYLYHKGLCGLTQNIEFGTRAAQRALERVKNDAAAGDAQAQFLMGAVYDAGIGVGMHKAEAVKWYRLASEQGYAPAAYNLGHIFATGDGVVADDAEAFRQFLRGAEAGDAPSACRLGLIYLNGIGVPSDLNKAFKWYSESAGKGYPLAMTNLGLLYMNGFGVEKNEAEASRWWEKSAREDHVAAYNLGVLYSKGLGVAINEDRSVDLWSDAARKGNEKAKAALRKRNVTWA